MVERDEEEQRREQYYLLERGLQQEKAVVPRDVIKDYQKLLVNRVKQGGNGPAAPAMTPSGTLSTGEAYGFIEKRGKMVKVKVINKGPMAGQIVEVTEEEKPATAAPAREERETEKTVVRTEALSDEEQVYLNKLEERFLEGVMERTLRKAREKAGGLRHGNLVPYDERELEFAMAELTAFRDSLNTILEESEGSARNPRAREIMERLGAAIEWVEGNIDLYLVSGATLQSFFDGWATLGTAVRSPRKDMESREIDKKYSGALKNAREGTKGAEILRKQDEMYEIYRGVAGIHHGASRNRGEKIDDDYQYGYRRKKDGDRVTLEQSAAAERNREKFVNEVLSHEKTDTFIVKVDDFGNVPFVDEWTGNTIEDNAPVHKHVVWMVNGEVRKFDRGLLKELQRRAKNKEKISVQREVQFVESISDIQDGKSAKSELKKMFEEPGNKDKEVQVIVGGRRKIDGNLIRELRGRRGGTMWVNGVEWKIDDNTIKELEWMLGSGDSVFIGQAVSVRREKVDDLRGDREIAILAKTAASLDNVFTMDQPPKLTDPLRVKLSLMLDEGIWDKLADPKANVDEIIRDFNRKLERHRVSAIDEHLIDTERMALLFFAEGADLGWGFDYKQAEAKGKGTATKIVKRGVTEGSTDACTDIGTALNWVRSDAKNTHKWWPNSLLPMDERVRRQIIDHEPGWAPWLEGTHTVEAKGKKREVAWKEGGWWQTMITETAKNPRYSYSVPFRTEVPTRFKMTMLDTITMVEPTEEMVKLAGKSGKIRPGELLRKGQRMSDLDWRSLDKTCQYRWFITFSQLALVEGMFGKKPDKRFIEQFFGNVENVPPEAYIQELNKRMSLGFRDLPQGDELKKIVPYAVALYQAYRKGMIPGATGDWYNAREEKYGSRKIHGTLASMNPEGDDTFGAYVAGRFDYYMEQLRVVAYKHLGAEASEEPWIQY